MEEIELDLRELLYVLVRRIRLLVILPLVAGTAAWLFSSYMVAPVYQASTTLWVIQEGGAGQISYNDLLLNRNLTKTYAEMARSRTVLQSVIDDLHLAGVVVEDLQDRVSASAVKDTEIIRLSVKDTDPVRAAQMANAVAASFQEQIRSFMKVENVAVVDTAVPPTEPVSPRPLLNTAIALVLGLMAAVGIAFLQEYMDTSLKTPDDVQRYLGLPVLATIPAFEAVAEPQPAPRRKTARQAAEAHR